MSGESDAGGASAPTDPDAPAGGDFAALAPDLTRRIGSILDAVQREADKMLADARREAQQQIELGRRQADGPLAGHQRRIAELSDTLIAHAESVVAQLEETELVRESFRRLLRALAEAADRVTAEATASPPTAASSLAAAGLFEPTAAAPATPIPPPVAPVSPPGPGAQQQAAEEPGEASESERQPADANRAWGEFRQAAIQMAAAGNTRAQVEAHLRGFLRVADPTPLLDQVFGTASGDGARVPWAITPSVSASRPDGDGS